MVNHIDRVTLAMLIDNGASEEAQKWFQKTFPRGMKPTGPNLMKVIRFRFNHDWILKLFLTEEEREHFLSQLDDPLELVVSQLKYTLAGNRDVILSIAREKLSGKELASFEEMWSLVEGNSSTAITSLEAKVLERDDENSLFEQLLVAHIMYNKALAEAKTNRRIALLSKLLHG